MYDFGSPTPMAPAITFNNPTPAADDGFGSAVVISGTRMAVTASSLLKKPHAKSAKVAKGKFIRGTFAPFAPFA